MKTNLISLLMMMTVCFASCKKENGKTTDSEGTIQLGLSLTQQKTELKSITANKTPAAIMISIADSKGKMIIESKKIALISMNGSYLSEPLSLVSDNYSLTKFIVLNSSDSAIYATPVKDSPLAYLVNKPLPWLLVLAKTMQPN